MKVARWFILIIALVGLLWFVYREIRPSTKLPVFYEVSVPSDANEEFSVTCLATGVSTGFIHTQFPIGQLAMIETDNKYYIFVYVDPTKFPENSSVILSFDDKKHPSETGTRSSISSHSFIESGYGGSVISKNDKHVYLLRIGLAVTRENRREAFDMEAYDIRENMILCEP